MRFDWTTPLIPDRQSLKRTCSCTDGDLCEHVGAFAYVVADQIDGNPSLLLQWRGCYAVDADAVEAERAPPAQTDASDEPWHAGVLPPSRSLRPLPVGAVLKCLGPTELRADGRDVGAVLTQAYASFSGRA